MHMANEIDFNKLVADAQKEVRGDNSAKWACNFGLHKWSKWLKSDDAQSRYCLNCNKTKIDHMGNCRHTYTKIYAVDEKMKLMMGNEQVGMLHVLKCDKCGARKQIRIDGKS